MKDPLECTYADAARMHLLDGIQLSTEAKVDFFEAMVSLIVQFDARDRRLPPPADPNLKEN